MSTAKKAISRRFDSSSTSDVLLGHAHTFKGKELLVLEVVDWFKDLNLEKTRVSRPSKFLFLCGGERKMDARAKPANLRDYLLRVRPIKTQYDIVLAEEATQLYRDTHYDDLITFEEDIARIAAVVLVIAESAGSLAELGAFSSNDTIRLALRVVIPSHHEANESFVRYGPVKRVTNEDRSHLGVYPWKKHANGGLNVSSVKPHYSEIVDFINGHLKDAQQSYFYKDLDGKKEFYIIYWIIHISMAVSRKILYDCMETIFPKITKNEIRNKLYCLELAKWIKRESYSGKDYFYTLYDDDPFDYSYNDGVAETSAVRRKLAVTNGLKKAENIPKYIWKNAASARLEKL